MFICLCKCVPYAEEPFSISSSIASKSSSTLAYSIELCYCSLICLLCHLVLLICNVFIYTIGSTLAKHLLLSVQVDLVKRILLARS